MESSFGRHRKWVIAWLFAGMVMVYVQILLGGVTRLTGSGLSITRWDIVTGVIPPLSAEDWHATFDLYKATPQYQQINEGMSLSQFKMIFFWEYVHRLWARLMGLVFLVPFVFFLLGKSLKKETLRRLAVVIFLAGLAAIFGWIMVASGLINRPWVNAYKLTIHLCLGISLFIYLMYTWMAERGFSDIRVNRSWQRAVNSLITLTVIQVCFGGFVSGMKSALNYPTWPLMHGEWIPSVVLNPAHWNSDNFLLYDQSGFMPALTQVIHRNLAYLLGVCIVLFSFKWLRKIDDQWHWAAYSLVGIIVVQLLLGILTLLGSKGSIPVFYGALHQGVGILFLSLLVFIRIRIKTSHIKQ